MNTKLTSASESASISPTHLHKLYSIIININLMAAAKFILTDPCNKMLKYNILHNKLIEK